MPTHTCSKEIHLELPVNVFGPWEQATEPTHTQNMFLWTLVLFCLGFAVFCFLFSFLVCHLVFDHHMDLFCYFF